MKFRKFDPDPDYQYGDCPEHGHVKAEWHDYGIGWYEAWGHKAFDTRSVAVCPECERTLENVE